MRRALQAAGVAALVFGLLVAILALQVRRSSEASREREQRTSELRAVDQVAGSLDGLLATAAQLRRSTALYGVEQARSRFPELARETIDLPVATSVALEQVVPAAQRSRFERSSGLVIGRPAGAPASLPSLVVTSAVSTQVVGSSLWGLDVFIDPQRRATLRAAFATGAARATPPVSGLNRLGTGLSVYLPLSRRAGMPMADAVGVSVDVGALGDHLQASLPSGTEVAIAEGRRTIVSTSRDAPSGASRPFSFAGRQWRLSARAPIASSRVWLLVLGGGLAGAALLAVLVGIAVARLTEVAAERQALAQRVGDLFAHSPLGLMVTDVQSRVVEINPALEHMLRTPAEQLLGRELLDLIDPEDRERLRVVAHDLGRGREATPTGDVRLLRRDGSRLWTQLMATPQRSASGTLTGLLIQAHDAEERRSERDHLRRLAEEDPLTGALNRRSFDQRLAHHLKREGSEMAGGALYLIDLDRFSEVNNAHGHVVGDRLLIAVADALRGCLREQDALGRLGGDEFAVLLAHCPPTDGVFGVVADRLRRAMDDISVEAGEGPVGISGSVGWTALEPDDARTPDQVLHAADVGMYAHKRRGVTA